MKLIAICGSARKHGSTQAMLKQTIKGAQSVGAEAEFINLFDLNYKDCIGCNSCKLDDSRFYGRCNVNDGLKSVFERIEKADILVLGSPVYYGNLSGQMLSFTDRLLYQYLDFGNTDLRINRKKFKMALIATMNVNDKICAQRGHDIMLKNFAAMLAGSLGSCELLMLTDTLQFDDYSKYIYPISDREEKAKRVERISAEDLSKAFELGVTLVNG